MTRSNRRHFNPPALRLHARVDASGGAQSAPWTPIERSADSWATDWQIILHLRSLFESNPALISTLIADAPADSPPGYIETLLVAAKEALAERPESVELLLHTSAAAARCGRRAAAESTLRRLLALKPDHAAALALLATVQTNRANHDEGTDAAEASLGSIDEIVEAALRRHGRRGNELPS